MTNQQKGKPTIVGTRIAHIHNTSQYLYQYNETNICNSMPTIFRLRKRARMSHFAIRSQPLPVDSSPLIQSPYQKVEQIEVQDDEQTPINLTSIIDTLLKDEE